MGSRSAETSKLKHTDKYIVNREWNKRNLLDTGNTFK